MHQLNVIGKLSNDYFGIFNGTCTLCITLRRDQLSLFVVSLMMIGHVTVTIEPLQGIILFILVLIQFQGRLANNGMQPVLLLRLNIVSLLLLLLKFSGPNQFILSFMSRFSHTLVICIDDIWCHLLVFESRVPLSDETYFDRLSLCTGVSHVSSVYQLADALTKPLTRARLQFLYGI